MERSVQEEIIQWLDESGKTEGSCELDWVGMRGGVGASGRGTSIHYLGGGSPFI